MKYFTLLGLLCCFLTLFAQKEDYHWITGYDGGEISEGQPEYGLSVLKFADFGKLDTFNLQEVGIYMDFLNVSMSDSNGSLQFYTNGVGVNNHLHELMENGDGMSGFPGTTGEEGGYRLEQGGIAVIWPSFQNKYFLITEKLEFFPDFEEDFFRSTELFYSQIDMALNENSGKLIEKRVSFLQDTIEKGKMTLTRHANGRDWWFFKNKRNDNNFYKLLVSPNGVELLGQQQIGDSIRTGAGRAVFSPDGEKYIIFNTINAQVGMYIDIYDFDRCSGLLSNPLKMHFSHDGGVGGVAISKNSRYLYHSSNFYIYQFDLWAEDIAASRDTVAVYDGFVDLFPTGFFAAQLAPDGKIYIIPPAGVRWMHTIEYPNREGEACYVAQHSLRLPTLNSFSIPNNPNYRLGPLDGSPCDTLGLDNFPIANFRADQDTSSYLDFFFQDLSYYEPAEWYWTFGDGSSSTEVSPSHTYAQDGIYEVCLTVSNENGSHTACDTLVLGTVSSSGERHMDHSLQVFPNPFQGQFSVVLNDYYPQNAQLVVYDELGRRIHQQRIFHAWNTVDGRNWPTGLYFYELWDSSVQPACCTKTGQRLSNGKIVKH